MKERKRPKDSGRSKIRVNPSEEEIMQLIQETSQQYEECVRLADLSDYWAVVGRAETLDEAPPRYSYPRYSWDTPIGLVIT